jgi:hypothetical protein
LENNFEEGPLIHPAAKTLFAATLFLSWGAAARAYHSGQAADTVVGQVDVSQIQANQAGSADANTLNTPDAVYQDSQHLFVVDTNNNRVLAYALPISTFNASAVAAIGQPDFSSVQPNQGGAASATTLNFTSGCTDGAVAGNGTDLFIGDTCNNRVLIYLNIAAKIAAGSGMPIAADNVIGQPDFAQTTANNGNLSDRSLRLPIGLSAAGTKLLIVDNANTRVMVYNTIPVAPFASADLVLGKSNFTATTAVLSQSTIAAAIDVWTDGVKVAVVEEGTGCFCGTPFRSSTERPPTAWWARRLLPTTRPTLSAATIRAA